jgi:hypothetical protein
MTHSKNAFYERAQVCYTITFPFLKPSKHCHRPGKTCRSPRSPAAAADPTPAVIAAAFGPLGDLNTPPANAPAAKVPTHGGVVGAYRSSIQVPRLSDMANSKPNVPSVLPANAQTHQ